VRFSLALMIAASVVPALGPACAHAREPLLAPAALALPTGVSRLTDHALVYVPASTRGPAPLILLLHGAGGNAATFAERFTAQADKRGAVLLAVQSANASWALRPGDDARATGSDPANIDAAFTALFAKAPVDPKRIIVAGFSDGASYALWLGRANARLFHGVLALSAGFVIEPPDVDSRQRIFIAHGRRDKVIPFTYVRNTIVPQLERAGFRPKTSWFVGGHVIDEAALNEGLDYLLAK
jgi:predicted esterase